MVEYQCIITITYLTSLTIHRNNATIYDTTYTIYQPFNIQINTNHS